MSEHTYNLVEEPFLLAKGKDGIIRTYGLRELLRNAHHLQDMSDPSPLVQVATLRLLLTIMYAACQEEDGENLTKTCWKKIWSAGRLPEERIDAYLEQWLHRFDLFDDHFPFFQVADLEMKKPKMLSEMALEANRDPIAPGQGTFSAVPYSSAEAARILIAAQSFSMCGLIKQTALLGDQTYPVESAPDTTLVRNANYWLSGDSLFQTLMLNLTPQYDANPDDCPCWEQSSPWLLRERVDRPTGLMDRYTWQGRLIRLLPERIDGQTVIRYCYRTKGRRLEDETPDPMHAFRMTKNGRMPLELSKEKAAWRDSHTLFEKVQGADKPRAFGYASTLVREQVLPRTYLARIEIGGIASKRGQDKIYLWRHERFAIPLAMLESEAIPARLETWLSWAENTIWKHGGKTRSGMARKLSDRTRSVVRHYLMQNGQRSPDPKDVANLSSALDPLGAYWARLENDFQKLLLDIVQAPDDEVTLDLAGDTWAQAIEREAKRAYQEAVINGLGESGRAIQAVAHFSTYFKVDRGE